MEFVEALIKAKTTLRLSDSDIARFCGNSRQWINAVIHRKSQAPDSSKAKIAKALCKEIDGEITRHAVEVSRLERVRADLLSGLKEV
ncbi:MAG: hypothetical protein IKY91_00535 [Akkermansia sp.]|nr:hypothetical protein [Akkermansia sp.]